jgi:hypothetical protein
LRASCAPRARAATAARACTPAQLGIYIQPSPAGGSAGATAMDLSFSNASATACTLHGFPGVSAIDQSGAQLGPAAGRAGGVPV